MIYYFNFSHDSALACGDTYYNPPRSILAMERDLRPLAYFFATDGDSVVTDYAEECREFYSHFAPKQVHFIPPRDLPAGPLTPWGWDYSLVQNILRMAADKDAMRQFLPSSERLAAVRLLSSRRTSHTVLSRLRERLPLSPIAGTSLYCKSEADIQFALQTYECECLLKAPWSSSGRGIRRCTAYDHPTAAWCRRVLSTQGAVEVEAFFDKADDFACEFDVSSRRGITFTGLSHFSTSDAFHYGANAVQSQASIRSSIESVISHRDFDEIINTLQGIIAAELQCDYEGPFGVDMMLVYNARHTELFLHPCVEINLRHTMGQLAQCLYPLLFDGATGTFQLHYEKDSAALQRFVAQLPPPLFDTRGRLCHGALLLVPLRPDSHFTAWLQV